MEQGPRNSFDHDDGMTSTDARTWTWMGGGHSSSGILSLSAPIGSDLLCAPEESAIDHDLRMTVLHLFNIVDPVDLFDLTGMPDEYLTEVDDLLCVMRANPPRHTEATVEQVRTPRLTRQLPIEAPRQHCLNRRFVDKARSRSEKTF